MSARPPLSYRLANLLLAPLLYFLTWRQARHHPDPAFLPQRRGHDYPTLSPGGLWIHCASVGETLAVTPLLRALQERWPGLPLTLSTNTPTGAEIARQRLAGIAHHIYFPLDHPAKVRRALDRVAPRAILIFETEIWPEFYSAATAAGIPLVTINGRISPKTLRAPFWLKAALARALQTPRRILARSVEDAERFIALGAPSTRVRTLGNIKYAPPEGGAPSRPRLLARDYVLAASTHEDEERRIAEAWLARGPRELVLVIAPRHPQRAESIEAQLRPLGGGLAVRSREEPVTETTRIYLADTLGELTAFMTHAEAVFMGGSLIPHGGHNLLEPARLGRPILCGPSMHNFRDETAAFRAAKALVEVADAETLVAEFAALHADPERAAALGGRAAALMAAEADVLERYITAIAAEAGLDQAVTSPSR